MKNIYRIDVPVYATAYIRASNRVEAFEIAKRELGGFGIEAGDDGGGDVTISGKQYTDPGLPDVSVSPAMTILPAAEWQAELGDVEEMEKDVPDFDPEEA